MCDSCPPSSKPSLSSRRSFLRLGLATTVATAAGVLGAKAAPAATPRPQNVLTPDQALARLIAGNKRYINGAMKQHDFVAERAALIPGQNPFAGILSCADSRVAPEYAFDTGRGDLFVVRLAGNFVNKDGLASFEYSVLALKTPLLVVLGHEACGAVEAAIDVVKKGTTFPGHIPSLTKALKPAVLAAEKQSGNLLANSIRENVRRNVEELKGATPILKEAVESGKVKVVGGVYNLQTGAIDFLS